MEDRCYLHTRSDATINCDLCERPICNKCVLDEGIRIVCPACVSDAKTRRVAGSMGKWIFGAVIIVAFMVGLGVWLTQDRSFEIESELDVQSAINDAPNNPDAWLAIGRYRLEKAQTAADAVAAVKALRRALALRPDHGPTLLELAYAFHRRGKVAETQDALAQAKKVGSVGPKYKKLVRALSEKTLAARYTQEKRDQERREERRARARLKADLAQARTDLNQERERGEVLAEDNATLRDQATEPKEEEDGRCDLDVEVSRSGVLKVEIEFEGTPVKMLVDTGASHTVISRDVFDDLGLELIDQPPVQVKTANGITEMERAEITEVSLAGITTGGLIVGICDGCVKINGLLGGELLRRYGVMIDVAERRVSVRECDEE